MSYIHIVAFFSFPIAIESTLNVLPFINDELLKNIIRRVYIETRHLKSQDKYSEELHVNIEHDDVDFSAKGSLLNGLTWSHLFDGFPAADFSLTATSGHPKPPDIDHIPSFSLDVYSHDLLPPVGHRLASVYSPGLPHGIMATWDGKWVVDEPSTTFLIGNSTLSSSITLRNSKPGYIRFSKPVLVKSLYICNPEVDKPLLVLMRRKNQVVWVTETIIGQQTIDVVTRGSDGHGPLGGADEIVIFTKGQGVKIAALQVMESSRILLPVMLLTPVLAPTNTDDSRRALSLKKVFVSQTALEMKQIVSLLEAQDLNLRVSWDPALNSFREVKYMPTSDFLDKLTATNEPGLPDIVKQFLSLRKKDYSALLGPPHELILAPPSSEAAARSLIHEAGEDGPMHDSIGHILPSIASMIRNYRLKVPREIETEIDRYMSEKSLIRAITETRLFLTKNVGKLNESGKSKNRKPPHSNPPTLSPNDSPGYIEETYQYDEQKAKFNMIDDLIISALLFELE